MSNTLDDRIWDFLDEFGEDITMFVNRPIPPSTHTRNETLYYIRLNDDDVITVAVQLARVSRVKL